MPPKKQPTGFDWMKYIPIAALLLGGGGLGGWYSLKSDVASAKEDIKVIKDEQKEDDKEYLSLQIQQTKIEGKVDQGYALLQEIRQEMKKK